MGDQINRIEIAEQVAHMEENKCIQNI